MGLCLISSLLFFFVPPMGCRTVAAEDAKEKAYQEWLHSLDFSFLEQPYAGCKVKGSFASSVSPAESCAISKLSARCSPADDCLVQCIASGNNGKVGGGCWHLCFDDKFVLSEWHIPQGFDACRKLGRINGG